MEKMDNQELMDDRELLNAWEKVQDLLPVQVRDDLYHRMTDWMMMGGKFGDRYMWSQIDYANKVIENQNKKKDWEKVIENYKDLMGWN
ncbi:MAG TPA: hypothetical protein DEQ50_05320 [Lactobacillus sp.]|uniref:DUF6877 domain-containing protein n=1 Tax=Companilactobacillus nuruki TaxID=1993540 RepID=A0A2N7AU19_9LACO|nr:DUF6877 family protein [Companilactobacillus nuruki]PMD70274.1 hypothetical protein CBP76_07215 [Companilactobacillus nuruki]HCD07674.1 hypothetical protein [Lactobacillus sp.]